MSKILSTIQSKFFLLSLSVLSGLLLWLSWCPYGFPFLIFFAFIPLFFVAEEWVKRNPKYIFWNGVCASFPAFLIWNVATTWWIWNSTQEGSIATFILNSFFMSFMFGLWLNYRTSHVQKLPHSIFFITIWLALEFLHLHWDLRWPWLNLGNVFAPCTQYVQWYSLTGTFGGSLWILTVNFLIFYLIKYCQINRKKSIHYAIISAVVLIVPIVASVIIYSTYKTPKEDAFQAVVVQPNTDPWNEQFTLNNVDFISRIVNTAFPKINDSTLLVVTPESSIHNTVLENVMLDRSYSINNSTYYGFTIFDSLIHYYPHLNLIVGLSTAKLYDHKATSTALPDFGNYYSDVFTSAMSYNSKGAVAFSHKSNLVPGVEKMPFARVLNFFHIDAVVINLGGPRRALGTDKHPTALTTNILDGKLKVGVPICYESIFGRVCGNFVNDGAGILSVITNDAWWKNTAGHKQHFLYAKLRAVETRRYVLRAANTGISAIIDPKGDVLAQSNYDEKTALSATVYPNYKRTFYVIAGDYIAVIALLIIIPILLQQFIFWIRRRFFNK